MPLSKILKATIVQTGTNAPVLTIIKNTFTGLTTSYISDGDFRILNTANEFIAGKTFVTLPFANEPSVAFGSFNYVWNDAGSIGLGSYADGNQLIGANGVFGSGSANGTPITIEVWREG